MWFAMKGSTKLEESGNTTGGPVNLDDKRNMQQYFIENGTVGIDQHNEPVQGSMYQDLWVNGPLEIQEYPDHTGMDHFKKPTPSYFSREVHLEFLQGKLSLMHKVLIQ